MLLPAASRLVNALCFCGHTCPYSSPRPHCFADLTVSYTAPFASALGRAAGCDPWAVEIFAEEVVRVSDQTRAFLVVRVCQ